ncbi:MAG: adenylyl-sulfate kinase [Cytophagales bacterium]|nr:MAG: adenylyl-sulfate kinase [Cytophagales bacterium]
MNNIHPIFDKILLRKDKEKLLKQKAIVLWMVGLSGSGKSTLAKAVEQALHEEGCITQLLDGDNLRTGINNNLGFSEADRIENIRRSAETAKLFLNCGIITICSFISPTEQIRNLAKQIIGEEDFYEVYIECPIEECEKRDVKGLYKKARAGEIQNFTGIDAPFEPPINPAIHVNTANEEMQKCKQKILMATYKKVKSLANNSKS